MAHLTAQGFDCGRPDGHRGQHRTTLGAAREAARKDRWVQEHPEKRRATNTASMGRWRAANPVQTALNDVRNNARRRAS